MPHKICVRHAFGCLWQLPAFLVEYEYVMSTAYLVQSRKDQKSPAAEAKVEP